MKKGIIYCRVSSNEQVQGTSLDSQERACLDYATKNNIEVVKVFVERGESATATNRTEFLKALEFCRLNKEDLDYFIVWKIDRFARNTTDHFAVRAKLTQYGITLQSVTEPITQDHIGKLMETFLAGYAEFENEVRKQRCTGGMKAKLREGIWCWSPPIGYTNSKLRTDRRKNLPDIPDDKRFYLIQKGLRLYLKGNHTITRLAEESNSWGLRTRTGKLMRKQLWEIILVNKFYAGILVNPWTKEEHRGQHQPMITIDEYQKIQMVKTQKSSGATRPRASDNPDFPLRRFVSCECHRGLTGSWNTGRGKKYAYYNCYNPACVHCNRGIARDVLEGEFYNFLQKVTPSEEFLALFKQTVIEVYQTRHSTAQQEKDFYQQEISKLEKKKRELLGMRVEQEISKDEYRELKDSLDNQMASLRVSRNEAEIEELDLEEAITGTNQLIADTANQWWLMESAQKVRFQKMVLSQGITYQKTTGTFGTAILSCIFKLNEDFQTMPSGHVAEAGFEPASQGYEPCELPLLYPALLLYYYLK